MKATYAFMIVMVIFGIIGAAYAAQHNIEITGVKVLLNGELIQDVHGSGVTVHATPFMPGDKVEVQVTVRGKNDEAFVGATITDADGNEFDFRVAHATLGSGTLGTAVISKYGLVETLPGDRFTQPSVLRLTVRLWEQRVSYEECKKRSPTGEACEYCKRNDYHMEGPIGGSWAKTLGPYVSYR